MPVRRGHSGKVDLNQAAIIDGLRKCGICAISTAMVGGGFPDIAASWRGANFLLEVKQPGAQLTLDEVAFHDSWAGQLAIVHSFQEAYDAIVNGTTLMQRIDRPGNERFNE